LSGLGPVPLRHLAQTLELKSPSHERTLERRRKLCARRARLISVLEEVDHVPLRRWVGRERNPTQHEATTAKRERPRALRVVDEGSFEKGGRPEPQRIPPFGTSEDEWAAVEEGPDELLVGRRGNAEPSAPGVRKETVSELSESALAN
jgi:hypothetical protein